MWDVEKKRVTDEGAKKNDSSVTFLNEICDKTRYSSFKSTEYQINQAK